MARQIAYFGLKYMYGKGWEKCAAHLHPILWWPSFLSFQVVKAVINAARLVTLLGNAPPKEDKEGTKDREVRSPHFVDKWLSLFFYYLLTWMFKWDWPNPVLASNLTLVKFLSIISLNSIRAKFLTLDSAKIELGNHLWEDCHFPIWLDHPLAESVPWESCSSGHCFFYVFQVTKAVINVERLVTFQENVHLQGVRITLYKYQLCKAFEWYISTMEFLGIHTSL